jgi:hypothetical protein
MSTKKVKKRLGEALASCVPWKQRMGWICSFFSEQTELSKESGSVQSEMN